MSALTTLLPLGQINATPLDSGSPIADTIESVARKAEAANLVDYSSTNQTVAVVLIFLITGLTVAFCYWQTARVHLAKARLRSAENIAMYRVQLQEASITDDATDLSPPDDDDSIIDLNAGQAESDRLNQLHNASLRRRALADTTPPPSRAHRMQERLCADIAAIDSGDIG